MKKILFACLGILVLPAFFGCQPQKNQCESPKILPESLGGDPLVKQGDRVLISTKDMEEEINSMSPFIRERYKGKEEKKKFLEKMIRDKLLAQEAIKRGLHKDRSVLRTLERLLIQKLNQMVIESQVSRDSITDDMIKDYYDKHKDQFNQPEKIRLAQIVLKDMASAKKVLGLANKKGSDFRELARQYSEDKVTKFRGGDLGFLSEEDLVKRFGDKIGKELISANVNTVIGVRKINDKFYVFRITGRRREIHRTLNQVKNLIRSRIYREMRSKKYNEFVEGLKKNAGLKIFDENLDKVHVKVSKRSRPTGMIKVEPKAPKPKKEIKKAVPTKKGGH